MSLYTRARKHIDMDRVKELREEKIKREQIAKLVQEQERIRAELEYIEAEESKYINWRRELEEGMNTSGMGMINYPANGDVDIIDTSTTFDNLNSSISQTDNYSRSGTTVTLQGTENQIVNGDHTYYNVARYEVDGTTVSHVKITMSKGGGTSSWTDRDGASNFDDHVTLNIGDGDDFFAPLYNDDNLSSGTHIIPVPGNYKKLRISFEQFGKVGETGALTITNVSLQRRNPVNVFVSLDDPDSSAFVRDGDFDRLSNAEKKKKLEEQLRSSDEYLKNKFGEGMPKSATISDVQPQQSFSDIAQGLPYTDEDDAFDDPYYKGPPPDLDDDSDFNPDDFEYAMNQGPSTPVKYDSDMKQLVPNPGGGRVKPGSIRLKGKAKMMAHYEPQGEVIKEKKTFKDITKKIPGYYDGKPSPLGFPVEEPPKMKNGFHPDLVDGKKVANRFNRLDPQSAKAMPKTGNPHIDKKVRAAAKKPK